MILKERLSSSPSHSTNLSKAWNFIHVLLSNVISHIIKFKLSSFVIYFLLIQFSFNRLLVNQQLKMFSPTKQGACYKIIILGNSSVGKTSILMRYIDGTFSQHRATIGTDIFVKSICINEKTIKLQVCVIS